MHVLLVITLSVLAFAGFTHYQAMAHGESSGASRVELGMLLTTVTLALWALWGACRILFG